MTERRRSNNPEYYRKCFELLSRIVEELNSFPPDRDIYEFIAATLKKIVPEDTIILVNSFDQETKTTTLQAVEGLGPLQPDIETILCRPLNGLIFPVPDWKLPIMLTGECNEIKGGLAELYSGWLPPEICKKIESMPFFGKLYTAGISWKGSLNGAATFVLPRGTELKDRDLITFFIRQVAGFLSRRDAENALRQSEERYLSLFDHSLDCVYIHDLEGNFIDVNPAALALIGYTKEDIPHLSFTSLISGEQLKKAKETIRTLIETGSHPDLVEFRLQKRNGEFVEIETKGSLIFHGEKPFAVLGIARDITERKRVEEELRKSEEKFRYLVEYALEAILILDLQGKILFTNDAALRVIECDDCGGLIGKNVMEFIAPESREDVIKDFLMVSQGCDGYIANYNVISIKGKKISVESVGKIVSYEGKTADLISIRDITERKRVEEALKKARDELEIRVQERTAALRQSKRHLSDIIDHLPDATFAIDSVGKVIAWNKAIEEMTGINTEEMLGKVDYEYALPFYGYRRPVLIDWIFESDEELEKRYTIIKREGDLIIAEVDLVMPDGRHVSLWGKATPLYNDKGDKVGAIESIRDVTERKKADEELRKLYSELELRVAERTADLKKVQDAFRQANKKLNLLNSITRHDINNQLTALEGYLVLLSKELSDPSQRDPPDGAERRPDYQPADRIYQGLPGYRSKISAVAECRYYHPAGYQRAAP